MSWRILEYAHLLHRELHRSGIYRSEGRMPSVLPVVVYNGERPWPRSADRLRRYGGLRLPPLEDLERALAERRGGEMATLMDARIRVWRDELVAQGQAQGIERGRADERALLCRQAARRFGTDTAQRLSGLLESLKAADELAVVGDWIVDCETGADLLARVRAQ